MKERKQIDIDRIVAFRNQLNRVSKNTPGASEVKQLFLALSDDAVELLMDFTVATCGLDLDASKIPLLVASLKVDRKDRLLDFLRANNAIQLDAFALPRPYKDIFIDFLVDGYKSENEQKLVRKLVLYYIRTDRSSKEFEWVDFEHIDALMKRTIKDDYIEDISSSYKNYYIELHTNAHKAIVRILELANAVRVGRRPHNLLRRLAKDDRYANIPEYPAEEDQSQKDRLLLTRLTQMFGIGMLPITRRDIDEMIRRERV